MKKPPLSPGRRPFARRFGLFFAFGLLTAACSTSEPPIDYDARPSTPEVPLASPQGPDPAAPGAGEPGTVFGLPGEETPASAPPENEGPGATETNFLTPPCGDGARERPDAGSADAGANGARGPDAGATLGDAGAARKACPAP